MSDAIAVRPVNAPLPRGRKWNPITGGVEITGVLQRKLPRDASARDSVEAAAADILGRAYPPGRPGQEAGLVVGYVQSGKTLSFTAVAALARDNGYQLVIVIAGSSIQLSGQSRDRLQADLGLTPDRPRTWTAYHNPQLSDHGNIQRIFDEWRDGALPEESRQTVLITVMKQHRHLRNLTAILRALNLDGVSALIIDDEADQASLNNEVADNTQSTTYQRILDLRAALPRHTLLQYTATPQAPLLINIIDTLSPNFVEVLAPGETYTGGHTFFVDHPELIRIIPWQEVPTAQNPLANAPDTLIESLRVFMLGVAAGLIQNRGIGNRSMLVHPSHLTIQHQDFYSWISDIVEEWRTVLRAPEGDADRSQLIADFQVPYNDLGATVANIPPFPELLRVLPSAFNRTNIMEVNRRRGGRPVIIDWGQQYAWILVGGQAMDRGYTVEGLTVTYMPRGIGVGNADTIEQRARFFGYKRDYIGYCRVYLERQTCDAFEAYVEHEDFMRAELERVSAQGIPLNNWRRSFILDPNLKPCRDEVLEFDYMRGLLNSEWFAPNFVAGDDGFLDANRSTIGEFTRQVDLVPDEGHPGRTNIQTHRHNDNLALRMVVDELFAQYRVHDPIDSQRLMGVLLQLGLALDANGDEECAVFQMSGGLARERGVSAEGRLATNLFQGAAPPTGPSQGQIYPGDRMIYANDRVTIQIHNLTLTHQGVPNVTDVPVLAVWIPQRLRRPWLLQRQPTQNG